MRERGYPPSVRGDRRGDRPHVAVDGAQPPQHAAAARLPPPRPNQAAGDRGAVGPQLRRGDGTPAGPPRAARRRRRGRHGRARRGERRGAAAGAGRLHGRGRAVHAPGARRLDDRCRHPRRRLRDRRAADDRQDGDIVVAGIPGGEATVKTTPRDGKVVLEPSNATLEPMVSTRPRWRSTAGSSPSCAVSDSPTAVSVTGGRWRRRRRQRPAERPGGRNEAAGTCDGHDGGRGVDGGGVGGLAYGGATRVAPAAARGGQPGSVACVGGSDADGPHRWTLPARR